MNHAPIFIHHLDIAGASLGMLQGKLKEIRAAFAKFQDQVPGAVGAGGSDHFFVFIIFIIFTCCRCCLCGFRGRWLRCWRNNLCGGRQHLAQ